MAFRRLSDTRMEIREGGGCLSIFGLPFLLAGLFMMLLAAGVVPLSNASDFEGAGRLIPFAVGLIFALVGGLLVFGRSRMVIDVAEGSIHRYRGLLSLPISSRSFPINTFESVLLQFEAGDSDSHDTYPVTLKGSGSAENLKISSNTDYASSLDEARQLAVLLNLPLEDATTDHKTVLAPDQVDQPLVQRLQESREEVWAAQPVSMKSKVEILPGGLQITIPGGGFHVAALMPLVVLSIFLFGILSNFLSDIMDFFQNFQAPDGEWGGWFGLTFLAGLVLGIWLIAFIARHMRGFTVILIANGRIEITKKRLWSRKVLSLELSDIHELDYGGLAELTASLLQKAQNKDHATMPTKPLPVGVSFLLRLARSKGITVKHRGGFYTFGGGLPDEEVKYLYSLVRQALSGRL